MCERGRAVLAVVAFALLRGGGALAGRLVPHTPCPKLFNYFESETSEIFGAMRFDNDLSGVYDLEVNMSIAMDTDKNIRIVRRTADYKIQNGESVEYYVLFPYNHTFPKLTSITFNKKLYCVGPPEDGAVTTSLSKRDILKIRIVEALRPQTTTPAAPSIFQIQININSKYKDGECGVNIDFQPLVLQGRPTKEGEYPWLVPLFYLENETYNFRCAGTLISNKHVITAAHCVRTIRNTDIDRDNLLAVFGRHSIKNWAVKSTLRGVSKFIVHPDYVTPGDADVAVIITDSPVDFNVLIKPICLWDEPITLATLVGEKGVVAGWGRDETGQNYVNEPRQLDMPVVKQETCLRSDPRFLKLTSNRTFCAGERDGKIPCTGDSGGGFVMRRNGKWKLRGVVSVALADPNTRSCDGNNYVVFSDVPKYNAWLTKILKED